MSNEKTRRKKIDPRVQKLIDAGEYTILKHNINEKLLMSSKSGLTINEIRILCAVMRQTLGYGHFVARIATSRFEQLTGIHPRNIRVAVKALETRLILTPHRPHCRYPKIAKEWGVNFNENDWMLGKLLGGKSAQGANRVHSERAITSSEQRANQRTIRDKTSLKETNKRFRPTQKHAELIEKLKHDGVKYAGL